MKAYSRAAARPAYQILNQMAEEWGGHLQNLSGVPRAVKIYGEIIDQFGSNWSKNDQDLIAEVVKSFGYSIEGEYFQCPANLKTRLEREHRIRTAKRIGLRYLAAAKYGATDPHAYKVWQDMTATPDKPNGEFDGCGVWGLAPSMVEQAWQLSGCRDSRKFRTILFALWNQGRKEGRYDGLSLHHLRKSHGAAQVANIMRAKRWLAARNRTLPYVRSPKHLEYLGRVSAPLRYAMLRNYAETKQLDFGYAAEVQHWTKAQKATLLSPKEAWFFLYGRCPFEKGAPHPAPLTSWSKASGIFARLASEFGRDESGAYLPDMLLPIFNLAAMFGSEGEIRRFVKGWTVTGIHDAGQFTLPRNAWTPSKWSGFCHKFPEALKYAQQFGNIEAAGEMPRSLAELRDIAGRFVYDNSHGLEALATACNSFGLTQEQFEAYASLTSREKVAESCPGVDVRRGQYRLYKLDATDIRGPLLGLYTDCCQHLDGAGAACARHGWQDPTSAFYVVEYRDKIVAQSWAWRSKNGDLVFDSIEGRGGYDYNTVAEMFVTAAEQIVGRLCIARVLVGYTSYGITQDVRHYLRGTGLPCENGLSEKMRSACSYMDGRSQWLLCQSGEPVKFKKADIPTFETASAARNELQEGSDVFCEHCNAEVHPDCEICPACDSNIAEWV